MSTDAGVVKRVAVTVLLILLIIVAVSNISKGE